MGSEVDEQKITTVVKTKDPKRVEAGKKLAALSKAAREKKKGSVEKPPAEEHSSWNVPIAVVGLLIAAGSLYFTYVLSNTTPKASVAKDSGPPPVVKDTYLNLESLDQKYIY